MKKIQLVTPAPRGSRKGNRMSADRWARIIRELGYRVQVATDYAHQPADLLIALHARKSGHAVERFRTNHPSKPLVVALTGTDLYADLPTNKLARQSLQLADRLVVLQSLAINSLPTSQHSKVRIIYHGAEAPGRRLAKREGRFDVCVSGHLRKVKDPFRTAMAVRRLPPDSAIKVSHLGAALSQSMHDRAIREMDRNDRYRWLGSVTHTQALRTMDRCRLLVISSKLEGCPTVLTEAIACDLPVLATRIDGNVGLLGKSYEGYFDVGDTAGLRALLLQSEQQPRFLAKLRKQCRSKAPLISPQAESKAWHKLLLELLPE